MPAVLDKASRFSYQSALSRNVLHQFKPHPQNSNLREATKQSRIRTRLFKFLGSRELDMPTGNQPQRSSSEVKPTPAADKTKTLAAPGNSTGATKSGAKGRSESPLCQDIPNASNRAPRSKKQSASSPSQTQPTQTSTTRLPEEHSRKLKQETVKLSAIYLERHLKEQLSQRREQIVNHFMALASTCLDKKLEPFEGPCDGAGCASHHVEPVSSSQGSSTGRSSSVNQRQATGEKRRLRRDEHEDSGDENEDGDRAGRGSKRPRTNAKDATVRKFACPYYKFDPERFGDKQTCCGPGFKDFHRVKEHLKRRHSLPQYQCSRCLELFRTQDELSTHQRARKSCALREETSGERDLADGYNREQEVLINKRLTGPHHHKWVYMYSVLFKVDKDSPLIPSPWHGVGDGPEWREGHTNRGRYEPQVEYIRGHFMPVLQRHIEGIVDFHLRGVEASTRSRLLSDISNIDCQVLMQNMSPPSALPSQGSGAGETVSAPEDMPFALQPSQIEQDLSEAMSAEFNLWTLGPGFQYEAPISNLANHAPMNVGLDYYARFGWGNDSSWAYGVDSSSAASSLLSDSSYLPISTSTSEPSVGGQSDAAVEAEKGQEAGLGYNYGVLQYGQTESGYRG